MKIEDEIKQAAFKSEYQKLSVNLLFTGNRIALKYYERLKSYGLTLQQYNALRILRGQYPKPATVSLLIERMLDKSSNASRIVDRLVAKELSDRRVCPKDRRSVDVVITRKGLSLLEKIGKKQDEWDKELMTINKNEAKILNSLLDKLRG